MASLVSAAILMLSDLGRDYSVFGFWLIAQCLVCGMFFLISLREKSMLIDDHKIAESSIVIRFTYIALGFCWGVVPGAIGAD